MCPDPTCLNHKGEGGWIFESQAPQRPPCKSCGGAFQRYAGYKGDQHDGKKDDIPIVITQTFEHAQQYGIEGLANEPNKNFPSLGKPQPQPKVSQRYAEANQRLPITMALYGSPPRWWWATCV